MVSIVRQIVVFVKSEASGSTPVGLDKHLLLGEVAGHVALHFLQKGSGFLDVDNKLLQLSVDGLAVGI